MAHIEAATADIIMAFIIFHLLSEEFRAGRKSQRLKLNARHGRLFRANFFDVGWDRN
jgi:hypothetical protein